MEEVIKKSNTNNKITIDGIRKNTTLKEHIYIQESFIMIYKKLK
jgi:hypothetical protein